MSTGISWTNAGDWVVGWDWKDEEINWFCCQGVSEEIKEIKEKIQKYESGKDYYYSPGHEVKTWGKCEKFTIYNQELKKELWKVYDEWFGDGVNVGHLKPLKPVKLDHKWPGKPIKPLKPIKPIRPVRPIGKPKENEKWKEYQKKANEYRKKMEIYAEKIKEYNQKLKEYNEKITNHNQEVKEKIGTQFDKELETTTQQKEQRDERNYKNKELIDLKKDNRKLLIGLIFSVALLIILIGIGFYLLLRKKKQIK